jgi:hypothetical protein
MGDDEIEVDVGADLTKREFRGKLKTRAGVASYTFLAMVVLLGVGWISAMALGYDIRINFGDNQVTTSRPSAQATPEPTRTPTQPQRPNEQAEPPPQKAGKEESPPSSFNERFAFVYDSLAAGDADIHNSLIRGFAKFNGKWPKIPPQLYAYAVDYYSYRPAIALGFSPTAKFLRTVWIKCSKPYQSGKVRNICTKRNADWRLHNHVPRFINLEFLGALPD